MFVEYTYVSMSDISVEKYWSAFVFVCRSMYVRTYIRDIYDNEW